MLKVNNMSINERNIDMKELKKGIQMILTAFNEQKEKYLKIINSLKEKIVLLEEQIVKLKEDNNIYQNKLYTLQKNIKCISKTICQLKDDEDSIEEKNVSDTDKYDKSNSSEPEDNLIKLTKDKTNDFFKKYTLNKLEIKTPSKANHKIQQANTFFGDNNNLYSRDDDIQIKKKNNIYLRDVYNTLNNNNKMKNKKESKSSISNNVNDETSNNKYYENKSDKEIKNNTYENNSNDDNINQDK